MRDNGHNIKMDQDRLGAYGAFGVFDIRERATLLGGEVAITETPDRCSEVRVRIPLAAVDA